MKEYIYTLKESFNYATSGGESTDATFLTLKAPSFYQIDKMYPIKQSFCIAMMGMLDLSIDKVEDEDKDEDKDEQKDLSAKSGMQLLCSSKHVDMVKVTAQAMQFFTSGVVLVEGEVKLTKGMWLKFSVDDFEGLLGEYLANFIAPSLTDGQ